MQKKFLMISVIVSIMAVKTLNASIMEMLPGSEVAIEDSVVHRGKSGEWLVMPPAEALTAVSENGKAILDKQITFAKEWNLNNGKNLKIAFNIVPGNMDSKNTKGKSSKRVKNVSTLTTSMDSVAMFPSWKDILISIMENLASSKLKINQPIATLGQKIAVNMLSTDSKLLAAAAPDEVRKWLNYKEKMVEAIISYRSFIFSEIMSQLYEYKRTLSYGSSGGGAPFGILNISITNTVSALDSTVSYSVKMMMVSQRKQFFIMLIKRVITGLTIVI